MEVSSVAVGAISLYRRHLSPRKGFRCAHDAVHGSGSCSDFGLRVFIRHDVMFGAKLLRVRFGQCGDAYASILATASKEDEERWAAERENDKASRYRPADCRNERDCLLSGAIEPFVPSPC
jgi:putative component of membrane protein insertase Oxa1/YidC/SpoIIIJ protein YidD